MRIDENKECTELSNYFEARNDSTYKNLLENCFEVLINNQEVHPINALCDSEPGIVKKLYAVLLKRTTEFVRTNSDKEEIGISLRNDGLPSPMIDLYWQMYQKSRSKLIVILLNIGKYVPHITNVKWKMHYIVKSSMIDGSFGPVFRISLITEQFDVNLGMKTIKDINFSCTTEELQDLVYKLKDIVRHCYAFSNGIL